MRKKYGNERAVNLLEPFEIVTTEMSSDQYISISKVLPVIASLRCLASTAAAQSNLVMGQNLCNQMTRRFLNIEANHILRISSLMDPKFKKSVFFQKRQQ